MQVVKGTDACSVTASRLLNKAEGLPGRITLTSLSGVFGWDEYKTHWASPGHSSSHSLDLVRIGSREFRNVADAC